MKQTTRALAIRAVRVCAIRSFNKSRNTVTYVVVAKDSDRTPETRKAPRMRERAREDLKAKASDLFGYLKLAPFPTLYLFHLIQSLKMIPTLYLHQISTLSLPQLTAATPN